MKCGAAKRGPVAKCPRCGFVPVQETDKATSLMVSLNYEIDGEYLGQSPEQLLATSALIKEGTYRFDEHEIKRVIAHAHRALGAPGGTMAKDLVKWLLWPTVIVVLILIILL